MTATEHQQRTARLLLDWWYFTGRECFLDYAVKTMALFDVEGRRGAFEKQCRRLFVSRKQIEFKRCYPSIIVDIQDGWFDSDGRWVGGEHGELCLEAMHSFLLNTYGLK